MSSVQSVTYVPGLYPPPPAKGREALGTQYFLGCEAAIKYFRRSVMGCCAAKKSNGVKGATAPLRVQGGALAGRGQRPRSCVKIIP